MTEFRPIPGFEGYTITPAGLVFRRGRPVAIGTPKGTMRVQLTKGVGRLGSKTSRSIERLLRETYGVVPQAIVDCDALLRESRTSGSACTARCDGDGIVICIACSGVGGSCRCRTEAHSSQATCSNWRSCRRCNGHMNHACPGLVHAQPQVNA